MELALPRGIVDDARFWHRTATRLARRLDLGRWLEIALPAWAALTIVAACALILLRNRGLTELSSFWIVTVSTFALASVAIFVVHTRRHRTTPAAALVWLEHRLRLNNRLTAAAAGIGSWPAPSAQTRGLLKWRVARLVPAPIFSVALLSAAALVPVTVERGSTPPPMAPPLAWSEMKRWLEEVENTELVEEQAVASWKKRLESLESQPKDQWFSHGSLEAGDSLHEELVSELRALERGLSAAEASLTEMIELDADAPFEKRRLAQERLGKALEDLDLATLPLSREVKRQLMTLARERDVRKLTPEELEKLRERLRERKYASLPRPGDEAYAFLTPGQSTSPSNGQPGTGGVDRGPGSAPLELADERTELGSTRIEDVLGREPLGVDLGETIAVGVRDHDVDTGGFRPGQRAGAVTAPGEGGELAWRQILTPAERRVLKKYFK